MKNGGQLGMFHWNVLFFLAFVAILPLPSLGADCILLPRLRYELSKLVSKNKPGGYKNLRQAFFNWNSKDLNSEIEKGLGVLQPQCNTSGSSPTANVLSQVLSGETAVNHAWPWAVFLSYPQGFCGGTLINQLWIVTAAHCHRPGNKEFELRYAILGTNDIGGDVYPATTQVIRVDKVFLHPSYKITDALSDIALVKLDRQAVLTDGVKIGCLASLVRTADFKSCYGYGWGATSNYIPSTGVRRLKQIRTEVMDPHICQVHLWMRLISNEIHSSQLCANFTAKDTGLCKGDSGNGISCSDTRDQNKYLIVGIGSYVFSECNKHNPVLPNVLTRITHFLPWILQTISDETIGSD